MATKSAVVADGSKARVVRDEGIRSLKVSLDKHGSDYNESGLVDECACNTCYKRAFAAFGCVPHRIMVQLDHADDVSDLTVGEKGNLTVQHMRYGYTLAGIIHNPGGSHFTATVPHPCQPGH